VSSVTPLIIYNAFMFQVIFMFKYLYNFWNQIPQFS